MSVPPVVHLAALTDATYAVPTAVMLTSVRASKKPGSRYCVHLFLTEPYPGYEEKVRELSSEDFEVRLRQIDISHFDHIPSTHKHVSRTTLAKFDLGELLPEVDKVLYIDGDALVRQDLTEYYSTELGENVMAATADVGYPYPYAVEIMGEEKYYINAGVMLLNLALMRRENMAERLLKAREEVPARWKLMDQDVFNYVCRGRIIYKPVRYNYLIRSVRLKRSVEYVNAIFGTQYESLRQVEEDAVIIHMNSSVKPWDYVNVPTSDLWAHYYHLSPYGDVPLTRGVFRLDETEAATAAMKKEVQALQKGEEHGERRHEQLKARLERVETRYEQVKLWQEREDKHYEQLKARVERAETRHEQAKARQEREAARYEQFKTRMETRHEHAKARCERDDKRYEQVKTRLERAEKQQAASRTHHAQTEEKLVALEQKLLQLEARLERETNRNARYCLFGFLPLLSVRQRHEVCRYRLFGFLPLLKVAEREGRREYRLFGFIPLCQADLKE